MIEDYGCQQDRSEPLGLLIYFFYLDALYGPMVSLGLIISLICVMLIAIAQRFSRWETRGKVVLVLRFRNLVLSS